MITKGAQLTFNCDKTCFLTIPQDWVDLISTRQVNLINLPVILKYKNLIYKILIL